MARTITGTLAEPDLDALTGTLQFIAERSSAGVAISTGGEIAVAEGVYEGTIAPGVYTVLFKFYDQVMSRDRVATLGRGITVIDGDPIDVITLCGLSDIATPVIQQAIDAAINAHTAEPDPHSQYATPAEAAAAAPVQTVFGRAGAVVAQEGDYTKAQVGLGNVDNTSDANKPVSTDQQTALDQKTAKESNLSDLANVATARENLGLGTAAIVDTGPALTEVPTGQDLKDTYDVTYVPPVNPTLSLDFAKQKYRMYSGALGLSDFAFLDKITCVRATANETYFDAKGILQTAAANTPIVAYDPDTGECLGLQDFKQSTNLLLYSDDLDNAAWAKTAATVTANNAIGAYGTLTLDKIVESATTAQHQIAQGQTPTSGLPYVISAVVGPGERMLAITFPGVSFPADSLAVFNPATGTFFSVGAGITKSRIQKLPNSLYRVELTSTCSSTSGGNVNLVLFNGTAYVYLGDGVSGVHAGCVQFEQRDSATPPIKTEASQVTRAASVYSMTGTAFSDWYRQDQGTFVARWRAASSVNQYILDANDGSSAESIYMAHTTSAGSGMWGVVKTSSTVVAAIPPAATPTHNQKYELALSYKQDDFKASRDGGTVVTDTSGGTPTPDRLRIGANYAGGSHLDGWISSIEYCPAIVETDMWSR